MLEVGSKAIDFTLKDMQGNDVSLHDFLGKKVVLYFYPKDNTPGCTQQACAFRDNYQAFLDKDVVVIGVSKDSAKTHANFALKYDLPFILLADPNRDVLYQYGVVKPKKMYGKEVLGTIRTTYIIDENGVILHGEENVSPVNNPIDVINVLNTLNK